jgi:hypothetical protein
MNTQINNPQTATISIIRQIKTKLIPKDIIWSTIIYPSFLLRGEQTLRRSLASSHNEGKTVS